MTEQCSVCVAEATKLWGYTPLCDNPACQQAVIEEINAILRTVSQPLLGVHSTLQGVDGCLDDEGETG